MALFGAVVIAKGVMTAPVTITATDPTYAGGATDTIDNFDIIGVHYEDRVELSDGQIRLRRQGQGSMDTSYIHYQLGNTLEAYDAAATHLQTSGRTAGSTAILHNVGLAAPTMLFSGDIGTSFNYSCYGIHNSAEICDAIEISAQAYGADGIPYTVWGVYKGLSDVIKTVDLGTDVGAGAFLVETSDAGYTLDKYELIRAVTVGKAPASAGMYGQIREKGGSLIGTGAYRADFFRLADEFADNTRDGMFMAFGEYGQAIFRGMGLPSQTHNQFAYYGTINEAMGQSHDVDSSIEHDALSIFADATLTAGTTYLTGIRK